MSIHSHACHGWPQHTDRNAAPKNHRKRCNWWEATSERRQEWTEHEGKNPHGSRAQQSTGFLTSLFQVDHLLHQLPPFPVSAAFLALICLKCCSYCTTQQPLLFLFSYDFTHRWPFTKRHFSIAYKLTVGRFRHLPTLLPLRSLANEGHKRKEKIWCLDLRIESMSKHLSA